MLKGKCVGSYQSLPEKCYNCICIYMYGFRPVLLPQSFLCFDPWVWGFPSCYIVLLIECGVGEIHSVPECLTCGLALKSNYSTGVLLELNIHEV